MNKFRAASAARIFSNLKHPHNVCLKGSCPLVLRNQTRLKCTIVAVALALLSPAIAFADALDNAETAFRAGQSAKAGNALRGYAPATEMQRVRALWVLALVEMAGGRPKNAAPLLERLVIIAPNDTTVRLQLARAYLAMGRDDAAHKQVVAAQAGRLSPLQQQATEAYLHQISTRKTSESYLRFAIVPETNAVKRTAAKIVDLIGLPTLTLKANAREKSGVGLRLGFGHVVLPRYSNTLRGRFGVHFDGKFFRDADIREATVTAEAGLEKALTPRAILGFGLLGQVRYLGGKRYSSGTGVYLSYLAAVGEKGQINARAELMDMNYTGGTGADGLRKTLTLGYRHALSPSLVMTADAMWSGMSAKWAENAGSEGRLSLGLEKAFDGGLVLAGTVIKGVLHRDGPPPGFARARRDELTSISLRAYHASFQVKGFAPTLELTYERQNSNIVFYDYTNSRVSLGLTKRF